MRSVLRLKVSALALAAILGLALVRGASAQTVVGTVQQGCTGVTYAGGQVTCQIYTPGQLGFNQALLVAPTSPSGAVPLQCSGTSGPGYTTQGTVSAFPPAVADMAAGYPGCEFQVTAGTVPAGAAVGTGLIGFSGYLAAGSVQQSVALCGDPTCGSALSAALTPPPPPTLVTFANTGSCTNWADWSCSGGSWQGNSGHDGDHDRDDQHSQDQHGDAHHGDHDHDGDDANHHGHDHHDDH